MFHPHVVYSLSHTQTVGQRNSLRSSPKEDVRECSAVSCAHLHPSSVVHMDMQISSVLCNTAHTHNPTVKASTSTGNNCSDKHTLQFSSPSSFSTAVRCLCGTSFGFAKVGTMDHHIYLCNWYHYVHVNGHQTQTHKHTNSHTHLLLCDTSIWSFNSHMFIEQERERES